MPSSEPAESPSSAPKIALYGGSFDPIHEGHLFVARTAARTFRLDRVLFVPAYRPPHKQDRSLASSEARLHMVELAVADDPRLGILNDELEREGTSYTVDTLSRFRERCGKDCHLYFVIGSDSLREFPTWREFSRIASLATLITVSREPGEGEAACQALDGKLPDPTLQDIRQHILEVDPHPASSTGIREAIRQGTSIQDLVPDTVATFIRDKSLYLS